MAPETIEYQKFSIWSDVWAFGVTLWEIYTFGQNPYSTLQDQDVLYEVSNGLTLDIPKNCSESIKNLMNRCWQFETIKRCNFQEIFEILQTPDLIDGNDGYCEMKPTPLPRRKEDSRTAPRIGMMLSP